MIVQRPRDWSGSLVVPVGISTRHTDSECGEFDSDITKTCRTSLAISVDVGYRTIGLYSGSMLEERRPSCSRCNQVEMTGYLVARCAFVGATSSPPLSFFQAPTQEYIADIASHTLRHYTDPYLPTPPPLSQHHHPTRPFMTLHLALHLT